MKLSEIMGAPVCLPGDIKYIFASKTWTAPADGSVRVCLCSGGGGGGNSRGGGASALAFWRWRKIKSGENIVFVIGAGGAAGSASANSGNGGASSASAPWGAMSASVGAGATTSATGAGGASGSGADYCYAGGGGGSDGGGALNPMDRPVADVTGASESIVGPGGIIAKYSGQSIASCQATAIHGWLSVINGSVPNPAYLYNNGSGTLSIDLSFGQKFSFGSGGGTLSTPSYANSNIKNNMPPGMGAGGGGYGSAGGSGFAIIEFCQAVY